MAIADRVSPSHNEDSTLHLRRLDMPRMKLLCATVALLGCPVLARAQTLPTNQRLYDTVTTMPDLHASRVAKFEAEPVVTGRVIFFGNSITQGGDWPALTGDSSVINRGIGADLTLSLLGRVADVIRRKPSKLFILIGINDISKDIPDSVIAAEYRVLVDSVRTQSPTTKIVVQSILPLNPTVKNFPQHYDKQNHVVAVNRLLARMAKETGATYVDLWPVVIDAHGHLDAGLTGDGLHLTRPGYERWVAYLKKRHLL